MKTRPGRADDPQQRQEDDQQDERGAQVVAGHHQQAQHDGARHERHEHVPPVGQLAELVLAREQVGAPHHQGELGDLRGLDLLSADGDPPGRAVLRDADAVDQGQAQPDDGHREQRIGEGAEQPGRRAGRRPHQRQPDGGAEQLLLEVRPGRQARAQVDDGRRGLHHDQAQPEQQRRDAEDQVVGRQRPVEQRPPDAEAIPDAVQAAQAGLGRIRGTRGGQVRIREVVRGLGNLRIHDSSLFAGSRQDPDIRRVSPGDFATPGSRRGRRSGVPGAMARERFWHYVKR